MPLVATWITVPGKPSSEITRLLPPPSTSNGSPRWSAALTAAMISSSVPATTKRRAGPPSPRVVKRDSLTGSRTLAMGGVRGSRTTARDRVSTLSPADRAVSATTTRLSSSFSSMMPLTSMVTKPSSSGTTTGAENRTPNSVMAPGSPDQSVT